MSNEAEKKVQTAVGEFMNELDKTHLRRMQGDMHRCAAQCCDDRKASMESVQQCMERCHGKLAKCKQSIETEMGQYQDRLSRCAQSCQDQIRDKAGPNPKESDFSKHQAAMDKCVMQCAEEHVRLLPAMRERIVAQLEKL